MISMKKKVCTKQIKYFENISKGLYIEVKCGQ